MSRRRPPTEAKTASRKGNGLDAARQRIEAATCDIVARDIDRDAHVAHVLEDVYAKKAQWQREHPTRGGVAA